MPLPPMRSTLPSSASTTSSSACASSWRDGDGVQVVEAEARVTAEGAVQEVEVGLGPRSYSIVIGSGLLPGVGTRLAALGVHGRAAVVATRLVGQVDAAIGGKTGMNHVLGKNLIGAFHQPRVVIADVDVLRTLPRREFIAGLSETIKYGIIRDAALFRHLEERLSEVL